jgi:MSHA pilin protein MshB
MIILKYSRENKKGFTLIELVAVIVLLGILAVTALPRFISLSEDAHRSAVAGTGAAFREGVNQVHFLWIARGSSGAILNFIPLTGSNAGGDLSVNSNGWPADTRGTSLTMNSTNDCIDVWRAVMTDSAPSVAASGNVDYIAVRSGGSCTYTYQAITTLSVTYNSNTGEVDIIS